jgi:uncharacterized protein
VKHLCTLIFATLILIAFHTTSSAQQQLIQQTDPIQLAVRTNTTTLINARRAYAHAGILKTPLTTALYFYQNLISEVFQTSCPHYPSCSGFAKDALTHFHLVKALALSADRLSRCTPMGINDYEENELNYFEDLILDSVNDY